MFPNVWGNCFPVSRVTLSLNFLHLNFKYDRVRPCSTVTQNVYSLRDFGDSLNSRIPVDPFHVDQIVERFGPPRLIFHAFAGIRENGVKIIIGVNGDISRTLV